MNKRKRFNTLPEPNDKEGKRIMFNYIAANIVPLLIGASFTCGVAVFYLVMMRTMKHRQQSEALNG